MFRVENLVNMNCNPRVRLFFVKDIIAANEFKCLYEKDCQNIIFIIIADLLEIGVKAGSNFNNLPVLVP